MSELKATPGPWQIELQLDGSYYIRQHTHTSVCVDEYRVNDRGNVTRDEDGYPQFCDATDYSDYQLHTAHLIAAAPEMYAELKSLRDWLDDRNVTGKHDGDVARIDAILSLARGES